MKRLGLTILFLWLSLSTVACGIHRQEALPQIQIVVSANRITAAPLFIGKSMHYFQQEGIHVSIKYIANTAMQTAMKQGGIPYAILGASTLPYLNPNYQDVMALGIRASQVLVSRANIKHFEWLNLVGGLIIPDQHGGLALLSYILKQHGFHPGQNPIYLQSLTYQDYLKSSGDFLLTSSLVSNQLEQEKKGYRIAFLSVDGGPYLAASLAISQTALNEAPGITQKLVAALYRAELYMQHHSAKELANSLMAYYPKTNEEDLLRSIHQFKLHGGFPKTPLISQYLLARTLKIVAPQHKNTKDLAASLISNAWANQAYNEIPWENTKIKASTHLNR